jgi:hypothetical protein
VTNAVVMRTLDPRVPRPRLLSTGLSRLQLAALDPVSPRFVHDPDGESGAAQPDLIAPVQPTATGSVLTLLRPSSAIRTVTGFYRDRLSWVALAVTSVVMCYFGGLLMFWYHAELLGEGGPAIAWYAHWMLDSTFGFLALTPALVVLLPLGTWAARALATNQRSVPWVYAIVAGSLFAVITTPGPIAHDMLVGRGTWLANQVTQLIGNPSATLTPSHEYGLAPDLAQQLAFGLPLYILLMRVAVLVVQSGVAASRRRAALVVAD